MKPVEELIRSQIGKAAAKLEAARILADAGHIDDAISRAYYAMFHAASAALLALGITVDNHGALRTMFGLHLVKTGLVDKRFGRLLSRLKDERENGDYDIYSDFDPQDARVAIDDAAEFVSEMKRFLSAHHGVAFDATS